MGNERKSPPVQASRILRFQEPDFAQNHMMIILITNLYDYIYNR